MRKIFYCIILLCLLITEPLWATSTGLNNIPTADVVPENIPVFQFISNLANSNTPAYITGFKYGPAKNIEIGLDGNIFPQKGITETLVAQGKLRFELSDSLAIAGGITNLDDHARAGRESPFGVLSLDFGFPRAHFNVRIQRNNKGFCGGIDKVTKILVEVLCLSLS